MIVLSAATYTLQLILSAGTADVDVSYVDRTATAYPIGATEQTAATATTQTICSAPAASTSREIDFLSVKIKTTGGVVTVQKLNSSGSVTTQLISVTLLDEEVLTYTHGSGWCALDANGNRKEATSSTFGAITATSITDSGLTATRVVFSGGGGLLSDDSGFTFNTTGDILTVGALNVAGTTAPTTGWYNPSGTVLRTPNAVTIDSTLGAGATSVTTLAASTANGNGILSLTSSTGTNGVIQTFNNTGGTYSFGVDNSVGGLFGSSYAMVTNAPSGRVIDTRINSALVTRVSSGGFEVSGALTSGQLNYGGSGIYEIVNRNGTSIDFYTNAASVLAMSIGTGGGITVGAPTGGNKGSGTANFAADIYKNNTAYTNPHGGFEYAYTGKVDKYADRMASMGLPNYKALTLEELERYTKENFHFPYLGDDEENGLFGGGERLLLITEELAVHLFRMNKRLKTLESQVKQ